MWPGSDRTPMDGDQTECLVLYETGSLYVAPGRTAKARRGPTVWQCGRPPRPGPFFGRARRLERKGRKLGRSATLGLDRRLGSLGRCRAHSCGLSELFLDIDKVTRAWQERSPTMKGCPLLRGSANGLSWGRKYLGMEHDR